MSSARFTRCPHCGALRFRRFARATCPECERLLGSPADRQLVLLVPELQQAKLGRYRDLDQQDGAS